VLFLTIITAFIACKQPQSFEYRDVKNIQIGKLGFDKTRLSMDLVYFNPNNFGVDLKKIDCDIYIDQKYLGKFLLDTTMRIDKKSEFTVPSNIDVDMKNAFRNGFNLLFSKEILLTVKGTCKVGKQGIFINFPVNYEARHKLDF
jgi:LEA14-like dessication related protein